MMQPNMPIGRSLFATCSDFRATGWDCSCRRIAESRSRITAEICAARAQARVVPSKRIGIVVLTNRSGTRLRDALPYEIIDRLLGLESAGLLARNRELEEKDFAGRRRGEKRRRQRPQTEHETRAPLPEYAADYEHPGYGRSESASISEQLTLGYYKFNTPLDHWHYETSRHRPTGRTISN